jgi:hypothetical protein
LCGNSFGFHVLSAAARHCAVHLQLQSSPAAAAVALLALHLLHLPWLHAISGTSMAQQQDM